MINMTLLTTSIASSSFDFLALAFAFAVIERIAVDTCDLSDNLKNRFN